MRTPLKPLTNQEQQYVKNLSERRFESPFELSDSTHEIAAQYNLCCNYFLQIIERMAAGEQMPTLIRDLKTVDMILASIERRLAPERAELLERMDRWMDEFDAKYGVDGEAIKEALERGEFIRDRAKSN